MSFNKDLQKGKLFGHPIHVMLVHFPLGLFPMAFFFDIMSMVKESAEFLQFGFYCMAGASGFGLLASIFGFIDFSELPENDKIKNTAIKHAIINSTVLFCYVGLCSIRIQEIGTMNNPRLWELISEGVLNALLILSSYYGGDLIIRYGVSTYKNKGKVNSD